MPCVLMGGPERKQTSCERKKKKKNRVLTRVASTLKKGTDPPPIDSRRKISLRKGEEAPDYFASSWKRERGGIGVKPTRIQKQREAFRLGSK